MIRWAEDQQDAGIAVSQSLPTLQLGRSVMPQVTKTRVTVAIPRVEQSRRLSIAAQPRSSRAPATVRRSTVRKRRVVRPSDAQSSIESVVKNRVSLSEASHGVLGAPRGQFNNRFCPPQKLSRPSSQPMWTNLNGDQVDLTKRLLPAATVAIEKEVPKDQAVKEIEGDFLNGMMAGKAIHRASSSRQTVNCIEFDKVCRTVGKEESQAKTPPTSTKDDTHFAQTLALLRRAPKSGPMEWFIKQVEMLQADGIPKGLAALQAVIARKCGSCAHAFARMDYNDNGELSMLEFAGGLAILFPPLQGMNVCKILTGMNEQQLFKLLDYDMQGSISLKEFAGPDAVAVERAKRKTTIKRIDFGTGRRKSITSKPGMKVSKTRERVSLPNYGMRGSDQGSAAKHGNLGSDQGSAAKLGNLGSDQGSAAKLGNRGAEQVGGSGSSRWHRVSALVSGNRGANMWIPGLKDGGNNVSEAGAGHGSMSPPLSPSGHGKAGDPLSLVGTSLEEGRGKPGQLGDGFILMARWLALLARQKCKKDDSPLRSPKHVGSFHLNSADEMVDDDLDSQCEDDIDREVAHVEHMMQKVFTSACGGYKKHNTCLLTRPKFFEFFSTLSTKIVRHKIDALFDSQMDLQRDLTLATGGIAITEGLNYDSFRVCLHRAAVQMKLNLHHVIGSLVTDYEEYATAQVGSWKRQRAVQRKMTQGM